MKKNIIIPIVISSLNLLICLSLLIFLTPNIVPLVSGIHDEILVVGSKWWLILGIVTPFVFMTISLISKSKYVKLLFNELLIFVCYDNMLAYSYFINESYFTKGSLTQIPLSLSLFLPLALAVFIYGSSIKNINYKNKFGLVSKRTTSTEFIWKQSHITASYHFMLSGFILFIVSLVFVFIHLPLVELLIFIISIAYPRIYVEIGANKMTQKYNDMKKKHDHLEEKKNKTSSVLFFISF